MKLPTNPRLLREEVARQVFSIVTAGTSSEKTIRSLEILALEARRAGLQSAIELVQIIQDRDSRQDRVTSTSYLTLYLEGYDHALRDLRQLLTMEAAE